MATPQQLLDLKPYEASDVPPPTPSVFPPDPPDLIQLKVDTVNVIEGRVAIESFPKAYQDKIKTLYRFSGQWSTAKEPFYPKLIRQTLDPV